MLYLTLYKSLLKLLILFTFKKIEIIKLFVDNLKSVLNHLVFINLTFRKYHLIYKL